MNPVLYDLTLPRRAERAGRLIKKKKLQTPHQKSRKRASGVKKKKEKGNKHQKGKSLQQPHIEPNYFLILAFKPLCVVTPAADTGED